MLVAFENDTILYPHETAMFQEIDSSGKLVDFNKTHLYVNDTIGLKTLFEAGKVNIYEIGDAEHLEFNVWELRNEFIPFLYAKKSNESKSYPKIARNLFNWS